MKELRWTYDDEDDSTDSSLSEQEATNEMSSTSEEETIDDEAALRNQFEFEVIDQAEAEVYFLFKVT